MSFFIDIADLKNRLLAHKYNIGGIVVKFNAVAFNVDTSNMTKFIITVKKSKKLTFEIEKDSKKNRHIEMIKGMENENNHLDAST